MTSEGRDLRPVLLKFGVALALSFAGFLYSRIRIRKIKSLPPPSAPSSSGGGNSSNVHSEEQRTALKDDIHNVSAALSPCRIKRSITVEENDEMYHQKIVTESTFAGPKSPNSARSRDKDSFLLPEFNDVIKELDFSGPGSVILPKKETETLKSEGETPKSFINMERDAYEQEIKHLKNMVRMLSERERNLEVQLLEYYGLKEQEAAVTELQSRLKINDVEAKLFNLKIESLQAENRRMEQQVADHAKVMADLENARSKIRMLKKKLRTEAEQNREQILQLQKRVEKLQFVEQGSDVQADLKLKQLEYDVEELRKSNLRLQLENSDLSQRLESTQILANCILEDPETDALKKEAELLRRENESLAKEVEQLQASRCSDVEELVYLRWINACLRYELRNYQPPAGKTVARDLSKTLSPKSEEKAKQLILEYATNSEVVSDKGMSMIYFDSDQWSSSHASCLTDSGELDDSCFDSSSSRKMNSSRKNKLFVKLRKLIHGKDIQDDTNNSNITDRHAPFETRPGPSSSESSTGCSSNITPCLSSARRSLDIQTLRSLKLEELKDLDRNRRNSDVGSIYPYKRFILGEGEDSGNLALPEQDQVNQESGLLQKDELAKYAKALKDSLGKEKLKRHKKSASLGSFLSLRLKKRPPVVQDPLRSEERKY